MQDWKKSSPQDCVSPRGHFAPRLFLPSFSFSEINSSAKIRMALKRHTVLYRLRILHVYYFHNIFFRIGLEEAREVERGKMLNIFGDFKHQIPWLPDSKFLLIRDNSNQAKAIYLLGLYFVIHEWIDLYVFVWKLRLL